MVTLFPDGTTSSTLAFLADDPDCENATAAWGVAADGLAIVGSDRRVTNGVCAEDVEGCSTDESGLRWATSAAVPVQLADYDSGTNDLLWSQGRDVGLDGYAVGYGVTDEVFPPCAPRALLWQPSGAIDTFLHDVPLDAVDLQAPVPPFGLGPEVRSAASGRNDARPGRSRGGTTVCAEASSGTRPLRAAASGG